MKTDHRTLVGMICKPLSEFDNERLLRLFESVSTYNLIWEYIKGRFNNVADALSCLPMETEEEGEMSEEPIIGINRIFIGDDGQEVCPGNVEDLGTKGTTEEKYRDLIKFIEGEQN